MIFHDMESVLKKLNNSIKRSTPFSLIRFGDGGLKFIYAIFQNQKTELDAICKKEGIPKNGVVDILDLWGYHARYADFIDSPQYYFTGDFWPRLKNLDKQISQSTYLKLINWKELYYRAEIDNSNFCNPELNYLVFIKRKDRRNIFDVVSGKRICFITTKPNIIQIFRRFGCKCDYVSIVGQYQNHYANSFEPTLKYISNYASYYDLWFVSAGELGRIYSGVIKEKGGRAFDLGFMTEVLNGGNLHPRLRKFLSVQNSRPFITLTKEGMEFEDKI